MRHRTTALAAAFLAAAVLPGCGAGADDTGSGAADPTPSASDSAADSASAPAPTSGSPSLDVEIAGDKAENVIVFIGDGLGPAQRNAARLAGVGLEGNLAMDSLPVSGRAMTDSGGPDGFISDSAAAGTALATGVKTYDGAVGVDMDSNPVTTLIERAEAQGKSTGLVTTGQVTDATPAAFGAHVEDRSQETEIARQFIEETGVDVLLGGGEDVWYPPGDPGAFPDAPAEDQRSRSDQGNLVDRAEQRGYDYVTSADELASSSSDKILGLFANQEMFQEGPEPEGIYDPAVTLEQMTSKAISTLSTNKEGFVLVVEEEAVDEMGHENNAPLTIEATLELDKAVAIGKEFATRNPNTLMVTTGDHETGGMAIEDADGTSSDDGPFDVAGSDFQFTVDWTTTSHTNLDVPVTAMGPGSENLTGVYENTHVFDVMSGALASSRGRSGR